ncbi:MAG: hypothetical protein V3W17_05860 [Desulfobacteria bacterium]
MKDGQQEITVTDFSDVAVQKAVRSSGYLHPLTLYPPVIGIGAGVVAILFGVEILFYLAAIGILAGIGNAALRMFFLRDKMALNFQRMKRKALAEQARRATEELELNLLELGRERAAKQVKFLKDTFFRFKEKLVSQIGKDKPEYEQYLGSAEVMYLAALNNLKAVADNERDKRLIDVEDSKRRIEELKAEQKQGIRDNTDEIDAQERQIRASELAEQNSRDLVAEVEGSLTALTEVTRSLSEITATRESMRHNVTQAMKKFHHISDRNKQIFDRVARSWQQLQVKY